MLPGKAGDRGNQKVPVALIPMNAFWGRNDLFQLPSGVASAKPVLFGPDFISFLTHQTFFIRTWDQNPCGPWWLGGAVRWDSIYRLSLQVQMKAEPHVCFIKVAPTVPTFTRPVLSGYFSSEAPEHLRPLKGRNVSPHMDRRRRVPSPCLADPHGRRMLQEWASR